MHCRSLLICTLALTFAPVVSYGADNQSFDSNGVKIHYLVAGKGTPVLLIHGFAANMQMQWIGPGIVDALAQHYKVIAFDNRGHGGSDKPHDPKQYGTEMVEDAIRLLDHLGVKKAHVVGYSMGAMITNKLITMHPDRVLTATLGGAAGLVEGSDTDRFEPLIESLEKEKSIAPLIVALTPPGKPKPSAEQIKLINQMLMTSNDSLALAAVVRSWKDLRISESKLHANKIPTLAVIGAADPLKQGVDELKVLMPRLKEVVIDDADHMTTFTKPEFLTSIQKFMADADATAKRKVKKREAVPAKTGG